MMTIITSLFRYILLLGWILRLLLFFSSCKIISSLLRAFIIANVILIKGVIISIWYCLIGMIICYQVIKFWRYLSRYTILAWVLYIEIKLIRILFWIHIWVRLLTILYILLLINLLKGSLAIVLPLFIHAVIRLI